MKGRLQRPNRACVTRRMCVKAYCACTGLVGRMKRKAVCEKGQGTTEYAILVGVLVVIAILAITIFKPKIEELWNAITSGIQGL